MLAATIDDVSSEVIRRASRAMQPKDCNKVCKLAKHVRSADRCLHASCFMVDMEICNMRQNQRAQSLRETRKEASKAREGAKQKPQSKALARGSPVATTLTRREKPQTEAWPMTAW